MDPRLQSYIETRDRRLAKDTPWSPAPLLEGFMRLLKDGKVLVGGRTTCGPHKDPTWTAYCLWNEVVRKANRLGYSITSTHITHGNGWATKSGGFWDEQEYFLESIPTVKESLTHENA